jgi:anti-sigma regulatory factor (Ser/Thr protein kinase)
VEVSTAPGLPVALAIDEVSMVGEARRLAVMWAARLGFGETGRGEVALVVTEAATNLLKHAGGGDLILQGVEHGPVGGLEVLALDRGPGMADVARCLADGYSTAGSRGVGLGAMARLSALFDIHSGPGLGTAVLARLWSAPPPERPEAAGLEFGVVTLPLAGEEVCGDAWAVDEGDGTGVVLVLVVDGLGHGPQAAEAAREAVRAFSERSSPDPAEIIRRAHDALRSTRGAAMAVARVDLGGRQVRFAGVGNIAGQILSPAEDRSLTMMSHNGTVGHTLRKVQEFSYPWADGALLVMHSDGLTARRQPERTAGLLARHPSLIAGVLYRDCKRGRDDATVLVARERSAGRR